jgi:hypothetical protein
LAQGDIPAKIQQEILDQMLARFDDMLLKLAADHILANSWRIQIRTRPKGSIPDAHRVDEGSEALATVRYLTVVLGRKPLLQAN